MARVLRLLARPLWWCALAGVLFSALGAFVFALPIAEPVREKRASDTNSTLSLYSNGAHVLHPLIFLSMHVILAMPAACVCRHTIPLCSVRVSR